MRGIGIKDADLFPIRVGGDGPVNAFIEAVTFLAVADGGEHGHGLGDLGLFPLREKPRERDRAQWMRDLAALRQRYQLPALDDR
jgi:hypothetical protein